MNEIKNIDHDKITTCEEFETGNKIVRWYKGEKVIHSLVIKKSELIEFKNICKLCLMHRGLVIQMELMKIENHLLRCPECFNVKRPNGD